jgi:hypothetical protein
MRKILMSTGHRVLKVVRQLHLYLGVFTAPMLLFFAITGGLQTFSLHETTRGSSYVPPAWLMSMAQLHKKQTTVMPARRVRPEVAAPSVDHPGGEAGAASPPNAQGDVRAAPSSGGADNAGTKTKKSLLPMKIFFGLVALSLLVSTLTGLYMAWRFSRKPKLIGVLLFGGVLVPLLLSLL